MSLDTTRRDYSPSLTKDQCALFLRQAGYPTMDSFAQFLTSYRGGMLVNTQGMTNSQIAAHAGLDQAVVDSLMASRDFALMLREHIVRSIVSPQMQAELTSELLSKTRATSDIRQMVAGLKHMDEMAGLGPDQQQHQPKTLIVRYQEDRVTSPYEDVEPEDAEFQVLEADLDDEIDLDDSDEEGEEDDDAEPETDNPHLQGRERQNPREAKPPVQSAEGGSPKWHPKRTQQIDLGRVGTGGTEVERGAEEAEKRKASGLAQDSEGDSQEYPFTEWSDG